MWSNIHIQNEIPKFLKTLVIYEVNHQVPGPHEVFKKFLYTAFNRHFERMLLDSSMVMLPFKTSCVQNPYLS